MTEHIATLTDEQRQLIRFALMRYWGREGWDEKLLEETYSLFLGTEVRVYEKGA